VRLEWDAVTTNADGSPINDLAGYRLFRSRSSMLGRTLGELMADPAVVKTALPAGATTCQVTGLEGGATYYFRLVAVDSTGNASGLNVNLSGQDAEVTFTAPLP
jgi:hypothetical protein